ncbi:unnamed protein product [Mytilus edulis]|uniref:Uncharacterized protein n=1 Tax=Mytilus edulis TaxID=6550 RepID=A0A8S3T4F8_MYTED|nr:unnamed protein product [Mytilus edulis]
MESKLKAVRRGHRGQVTKLFKKFDEIENNSDLDKDDVKLISDAIEQKQRTIVDLNEKILDLTSEEDVAEEIQESDEYMFNLESKLRKIRKITHSDSISQNVASTSLDPNANSFNPSHPQIHRLPMPMLYAAMKLKLMYSQPILITSAPCKIPIVTCSPQITCTTKAFLQNQIAVKTTDYQN